MLLGVPAGFIGYVIQQALLHPFLGWMLWHHPFVTVLGLIGGGAVAGLARLGGLVLMRDSFALHAWMVGAACVIYLRADRNKEALTR